MSVECYLKSAVTVSGPVFVLVMHVYHVYEFLLLCMFTSGYFVLLCCSVYCLCVNMCCTTATGCQPNCS